MACTVVRARHTSLFCIEEHLLPRSYRMPLHEHRAAGLVLGLGGSWIGELGRTELGCGPGDLIVLPHGAAHRERSPAGGRCLLVSMREGTLAELEPDTRRRFDVHQRVAPPQARRLARSLAAALAADARAIALDELVMEALSALGGAADTPAGAARWLRRIRDALEADILGEVDLASLALAAGRSREHVQRRFRAAFGLPPAAYLRARRIERAASLLNRSELSIAAIAVECGFTDQSHLTRLFRARFGVTPACFRRRLPR